MTEAGSGSDQWFYKLRFAASVLLAASFSFFISRRLWRWSVQVLLQAGITRSLQS